MTARERRIVVHLSDLHFGREDRRVVAELIQQVTRLAPALIAVSGDLTQRARRSQFRRARAFLEALPFPRLVVPGNHDVPLFNVVARLLNPLGGYRRAITADLQPVFVDPLLTVVGMNTTKPSRLKSGRVHAHEVDQLRDTLANARSDTIKIFVGHHPFELPDDTASDPPTRTGPRAKSTLEALTGAGIDAFLTGHLHVSYTGHTAHRYNIAGRSAIVVEAGTATSTRLRENANAFNVLDIEPDAIVVERHEWQGSRFAVTDTQRFRRTESGWAV